MLIVLDDGRSEIQMELLSETVSSNVNGMTLVFHVSNNYTMVQGLIIDTFVSCENLTASHFLFSYNTTELDETKEWLELSINMTGIPCSLSEKSIFSAHIPLNCTFLDAMLIIHEFSPYGGITISALTSLKKRSTINNTLLSVYQDEKLNCSVQSVFLNYMNQFPVLAYESISVISPNSTGMNMTFCYGICNELFLEQPLNMSSTTRRHFISDILQDLNATIPFSCCVPDIIEHQEMIVKRRNQIYMEAFPQVTKCQCVI